MSYYRNNRSYRGRGGRYVDQHQRNQQYHHYPNQPMMHHHEYYNNDSNQHYYYTNNHGQHNNDNVHHYFNQKRQRYSNHRNQYRQRQRSNYQYNNININNPQQHQHHHPQYQLKPKQKEEEHEEEEHKQENKEELEEEIKTKPERSWIEYDEEDEDRKSEHSNNDINDNYSDHSSSEYVDEYDHSYYPDRESFDGTYYDDQYPDDTRSNYSRHTAVSKHDTFKSNRSNNYNYSRERTQNIRDMNNWCKYVNITHSIRDIYNKNDNKKINILDLGCGAGNDLYKCRGNKKYIYKYLAMDIDEDYITTARKKYFKILQDGIKHRNASYEERKKFSLNNAYGQTAKEFYDESIFDAQFVINDMTSNTLYLHPLINNYKPFHLINIQFALHFGFQTNKSILALLKTIKTATDKGSFMLCSFMRDDIIINRLSELMNDGATYNDEYVTFENQFQSITMKKTDFRLIQNVYDKYNLLKQDIENIYDKDKNKLDDMKDEEFIHELVGIKYKYFQMDSVEGFDGDGDYEWFVPFNILCKLLWKYCRMRLVYKKTASDIYIESSRKFPYKYGYSKGRELNNVKWTKDEQQVIDTYQYVMFQRV